MPRHNGFDHPIIDSDGHTVEFMPALLDVLEEVAGPEVTQRYVDFFAQDFLGWYDLSHAERVRTRAVRGPWWALPARNTLDRATASLPRLLYERLDELQIDFSVLYPSATLIAPELADDELRQAVCRAANRFHAELYAPYADRMTPAAVIPMTTPDEAIAELDHAVGELGLKVVMLAGVVERPVPAVAQAAPEAARWATWVDALGADSPYDYDPVWQRCVELGVSPSFHSNGLGWGSRTSVSSYVHNHLGAFAAAGEATCRSLFLGGVTRRFPSLRFAFLEGGVGWACNLYADLIGHWEKRGGDRVRAYDPESLDATLFEDLMRRYGEKRFLDKVGEAIGSVGLHVSPEDPTRLDEFAACGIERAEDIRELFAERFYFGCEADDPINAWAFKHEVNPFGARLGAIFSSDIGHWDVPDVARVVDEAWELVDDGLIDRDDFEDFTFRFPASFWTAANPRFFEGTAVEDAVAAL
jgi:predicted TIM-barrel fold metal-dependent hydrolase